MINLDFSLLKRCGDTLTVYNSPVSANNWDWFETLMMGFAEDKSRSKKEVALPSPMNPRLTELNGTTVSRSANVTWTMEVPVAEVSGIVLWYGKPENSGLLRFRSTFTVRVN